jgi:hypothetical protein
MPPGSFTYHSNVDITSFDSGGSQLMFSIITNTGFMFFNDSANDLNIAHIGLSSQVTPLVQLYCHNFNFRHTDLYRFKLTLL